MDVSHLTNEKRQNANFLSVSDPGGGGGGWLLSYKRLMGMCRWMGSHFQNWSGYDGVEFSIELLESGRTFSDFLR